MQLRRGERLNRGLRAYRGKDRGFQVTVRGVKDACPGGSLTGLDLESECSWVNNRAGIPVRGRHGGRLYSLPCRHAIIRPELN